MIINGISILIGYAIGCFQTAFILGKIIKKVDIREHGSGNAGATNAIRVLGWKLGMTTFFADIIKGIIAVLIARSIFDDPSVTVLAGLYAGLGVVIGHNWPVVLKFRGGKGIASTLGVLLAFDIRLGLFAWAVAAIAIYITRYVSLGSLILMAIIPFGIAILHPGAYHELFIGILLAIMGIYRHKQNIVKLKNGTENKLGGNKKNHNKESL